jgi:membrane protease YdiL (CAAX protease family)
MTTTENPKSSQGKLGELLRTNKIAILLEIAVVFVPLYILLFVSDRLGGNDFISLGGDVVLVGGPLVYVGMVLALAAVWVTSKLRGSSWNDFGLAQPKNWGRTILIGIGMTLIFMVAATLLSQLVKVVFQTPDADLSRFAPLHGNLPNLIINVVALWFTAGFLEEFLWRGYLMNRLIDLLGKNTKLAWAISLIGSAIIFGLAHSYQGLPGIIKISAVGLLLGGGFLAVRRNLWPLIIVHIIIDTVSMVQHFISG